MNCEKKISALLLCAVLGMSGLTQAKGFSIGSIFTPDIRGTVVINSNDGEINVDGGNQRNSDNAQGCVIGQGCVQQYNMGSDGVNLTGVLSLNDGEINVDGGNQRNSGNAQGCVAGQGCVQQRGD